jgi:hypothetical protein
VLDSCEAGSPLALDDATCDGIDDDCDGLTDEDYVAPATSCGVGACGATGALECVAGAQVDSCEPGAPAAADSVCNGLDDDCDGLVDEDYGSRSCETGDPGICSEGRSRCESGAEVCDADRLPQTEVCDDGLDNDCDGASDFPADASCVLISRSLPVVADEDDAEERITSGGSVRLKSADLYLTEEGGSVQVVGLRFRDLDVPRDARIVGARVQFASDETSSQPTSLIVEGEAADDAAPFSKMDRDVTSRERTSAAVAWEPPPWMAGAAGPDERTPELTPILQEIVDRPGWAPGHAIVLMISGSGHRTAHSYHGALERAPRLELEYVTSAP